MTPTEYYIRQFAFEKAEKFRLLRLLRDSGDALNAMKADFPNYHAFIKALRRFTGPSDLPYDASPLHFERDKNGEDFLKEWQEQEEKTREQGVPEGFRRVKVTLLRTGQDRSEEFEGYFNGENLVALEQKDFRLTGDEPEYGPGAHDCDVMTCGSYEHVMLRIWIEDMLTATNPSAAK